MGRRRPAVSGHLNLPRVAMALQFHALDCPERQHLHNRTLYLQLFCQALFLLRNTNAALDSLPGGTHLRHA